MIYEVNGQLLKDNPDLLNKFFVVSALTVSRWCRYFSIGGSFLDNAFSLVWTKKIHPLLPRMPYGPHKLPEGVGEKLRFVQQLVDWIQGESQNKNFTLFLHDQPIRSKVVCKFDHHDDTASWVFNLSNEEITELQMTLKEANLPLDLVFPARTKDL